MYNVEILGKGKFFFWPNYYLVYIDGKKIARRYFSFTSKRAADKWIKNDKLRLSSDVTSYRTYEVE